jgi:hypothetical protein
LALSIEEQRNLRDLLVLFFPQEAGTISGSEPNEETLEQTEKMLIAITQCTMTAQRFIEDLAGNRMIKGFLRKSLNRLLNALKGKDSKFVGNIGCTNQGKALYLRPIMLTLLT